jgi:hypothetical protein
MHINEFHLVVDVEVQFDCCLLKRYSIIFPSRTLHTAC